jgi:NAD(P)-dependent dehydrogenase (short-subunit alcohol dehydrogenase family)
MRLDLAAPDIDAAAGAAVTAAITAAGGNAHFVETDVSGFDDMKRLANEAVRMFGGIDILVNNAARAIGGVVDEIEEDTWNLVLSTNLSSVWRGMRVCVPHMRRRGKGAVVNMSSVQALAGFRGWAAYAAAKGGINALTCMSPLPMIEFIVNRRTNSKPASTPAKTWAKSS